MSTRPVFITTQGFRRKFELSKELEAAGQSTKCDFCGLTSKDGASGKEPMAQFFYTWSVDNFPDSEMLLYLDRHGTSHEEVKLCGSCDKDTLEYDTIMKEEEKTTSDTSDKDSDVSFMYSTPTGGYAKWQASKATTPVKPTCAGHFHLIDIPGHPTYGKLRLSSERGGMYIDTDAYAALFFSNGWKGIADPDVELYWAVPKGKKNPVPDLSDDDKSGWPPCAFVYWKDYSAPSELVIRYAKWAANQIKQGKTIQVGCMGGHGRTGTFAGLVMLELTDMTGDEVIDHIHKAYCVDAIEGKAQPEALRAYAR